MVNCAWCTCCIDRQFMPCSSNLEMDLWWVHIELGSKSFLAGPIGDCPSNRGFECISSWSLADNWDMSAQVNALTNPPRHWKWFSPRTQQEPTQWLWWSLMLNGGQLGQSNITNDICFGYLYNWWRSYCRNLISVGLGIVILPILFLGRYIH
jgi:hypothetical protein